MKKFIMQFFTMNIIFSCNKYRNNDISLNVNNITLNGKKGDFIENTLIILELNLINNSSNEIIFRASTSDNIYRKSRLILMDTISHQSIDIFTGDVFILKQKSTESIYG